MALFACPKTATKKTQRIQTHSGGIYVQIVQSVLTTLHSNSGFFDRWGTNFLIANHISLNLNLSLNYSDRRRLGTGHIHFNAIVFMDHSSLCHSD
jgi:hypothetical protein